MGSKRKKDLSTVDAVVMRDIRSFFAPAMMETSNPVAVLEDTPNAADGARTARGPRAQLVPPGGATAGKSRDHVEREDAVAGAKRARTARKGGLGAVRAGSRNNRGARLFEAPKLVGGVDGLDASVVSITKLPEGEGFEVVVEVASERRILEVNGDSFVQPRMRETIAAYVGDETVTAQTILVKAVAPDFANGRVKMASKTVRWSSKTSRVAATDDNVYAKFDKECLYFAASEDAANKWMERRLANVQNRSCYQRTQGSGTVRVKRKAKELDDGPLATVVWDALAYVSTQDNGKQIPWCTTREEAMQMAQNWLSEQYKKFSAQGFGSKEITLSAFWAFVSTEDANSSWHECPRALGNNGLLTWTAPPPIPRLAPAPVPESACRVNAAYADETLVLVLQEDATYASVQIGNCVNGNVLATSIDKDGRVASSVKIARVSVTEATTVSINPAIGQEFGGFECADASPFVTTSPQSFWSWNDTNKTFIFTTSELALAGIKRHSRRGNVASSKRKIFQNKEAAEKYAQDSGGERVRTTRAMTSVVFADGAIEDLLFSKAARDRADNVVKLSSSSPEDVDEALRGVENVAWTTVSTCGEALNHEETLVAAYNGGVDRHARLGERASYDGRKVLNTRYSHSVLQSLPTSGAWFKAENASSTCPFKDFMKSHATDNGEEAVNRLAWFIGLWLGDGTHNQPAVAVANTERAFIGAKLTDLANSLSCEIRRVSQQGCESWRIVRSTTPNNPITDFLRNTGMFDNYKKVPTATITMILACPRSIRCALLAGLIDSDGYTVDARGGGLVIAQTSEHDAIVDLVCVVAQSLGACVRRGEHFHRERQFIRGGGRTLTEEEISQTGGEASETRWNNAGCPRKRTPSVEINGLCADLAPHMTVPHKKSESSRTRVDDFVKIRQNSHELARGASGYFVWKRSEEKKRVVTLYAECAADRIACVVTPTGFLLPIASSESSERGE